MSVHWCLKYETMGLVFNVTLMSCEAVVNSSANSAHLSGNRAAIGRDLQQWYLAIRGFESSRDLVVSRATALEIQVSLSWNAGLWVECK